jgi:translation initiation factor 2B subunit (eIF-2B alpha/beta/delta family)
MPGTGTNRLCCHYYACSQKGIIQELENRLEDERTQHSKDKAKAEAKSKADLDRVRIESAEELKHVLESAALQHKQQQDIILTLQVSTSLRSFPQFVLFWLQFRLLLICQKALDQ